MDKREKLIKEAFDKILDMNDPHTTATWLVHRPSNTYILSVYCYGVLENFRLQGRKPEQYIECALSWIRTRRKQ